MTDRILFLERTMLENIAEILFVLSFVAPIVALVAGVSALAVPTKLLRRPISTTRKAPTHA